MRLSIISFTILTVFGISYGQSVQSLPVPEFAKTYPIDPMPLLYDHYREAAEYALAHPEMTRHPHTKESASWNFKVGDAHSWWVSDLKAHTYYQDKSTCRGIGKHCYVFVEDSMWTSRVTQGAVDSIINDFDNMTPANPSRGIFETDSLAFGAPPDVDGDPKIIILICNVRDGFTGTGGYVEGFFDPKQEVGGSYSNSAEIYYLDANPTDLTHSSGIQSAMSTAAHEFQHMINYNYHKTSVAPVFINESCSKLAEVICGYPVSNLSLYSNETNHYLFDWRGYDNTIVLNDYARAQRFSIYLWDRFGIGVFKYVVQSNQVSEISILNDAFSKAGIPFTFNDIFKNWLIANELNDTTGNRMYGYAYPALPASNGKLINNPNTTGCDSVEHVAASYLIFKNGSNLKITFINTTGNANLQVQAIETGPVSKNVLAVPFGSEFSEPGYGTTYTTIAFVAINRDPANFASFSYKASGSVSSSATEIKYDNTEPVGYYSWSMSDTVCVTFDAFPQGILDSVRIGFRKAGSISGGIYRYTGVQSPTPLGELVASVTASISTTSPLPYPVPFQNWTTVDLTSSRINTDRPFAVALVIPDDSGLPGMMIANQPRGGPYHSYTYLKSSEASPKSAGWYVVSSSDSTIATYLIRAYVSIATAVKDAAASTPRSFGLSQNYPNPFNPTTNIEYRIAVFGFVTLKVFDVLGRQVATLVNELRRPGDYSVVFDGRSLPSGVYFCRLTATPASGERGFSLVRKLVLVK